MRPLNADESVNVTGAGFRINVSENIPMGHKISLHEYEYTPSNPIAKNEARKLSDPEKCPRFHSSERVKILAAQNEDDEHESAMKILRELAEIMREDKRVPCDSSALIVGLKCGSSNGLTGYGDIQDRRDIVRVKI